MARQSRRLLLEVWAEFAYFYGMHIAWWNIERGETNERVGGNPLGAGLRRLIDGGGPDILILGEFRAGAIDAETLSLVRRHYSELFFPFNEDCSEEGFLILTRGLEAKAEHTEPLDWTPHGPMEDSEREAYRRRWSESNPDAAYFTKPYIRVSVKGEGLRFSLLPVHLIQPWERIRHHYGKWGFLAAGLSVLWGRSNPSFYQAQRMRQCWLRDFGKDLSAEPLIVVGDFNVPFLSPGYSYLKRGLRPVFALPRPTFPTREASRFLSYPPMQLDHGLVSKDWRVEEAKVLRMTGSDHFPIRFRLKMKTR